MKDLPKRHRAKDGETPKQGVPGEKRAAKQSDPTIKDYYSCETWSVRIVLICRNDDKAER